ncbi:MAG: nitroreductase family deazaflavin-dependent oxidoreductase [Mycobacterium sp.]
MRESAKRRAIFNRKYTNRVVEPLSGWLPLWSVIEHVGRKSGKSYRTPVTAFSTTDGVAVLLPYGTDTDWVRNLTAAGGGRVQMLGRTFAVTDPRVVPTDEALTVAKAPWGRLLKATGVESALLLTRAR